MGTGNVHTYAIVTTPNNWRFENYSQMSIFAMKFIYMPCMVQICQTYQKFLPPIVLHCISLILSINLTLCFLIPISDSQNNL